VRERVLAAARWLGVQLDPALNREHGPRLTSAGSRVSGWTIATNEELMIARHTRAVIGEGR
jgi:acetate kinase